MIVQIIYIYTCRSISTISNTGTSYIDMKKFDVEKIFIDKTEVNLNTFYTLQSWNILVPSCMYVCMYV